MRWPASGARREARTGRVTADPEALQRVIVLDDGAVAGDVAAWRADGGVREVGYRIGRRYWGRGIATAALVAFLAEFGERPLSPRPQVQRRVHPCAGEVRILPATGGR